MKQKWAAVLVSLALAFGIAMPAASAASTPVCVSLATLTAGASYASGLKLGDVTLTGKTLQYTDVNADKISELNWTGELTLDLPSASALTFTLLHYRSQVSYVASNSTGGKVTSGVTTAKDGIAEPVSLTGTGITRITLTMSALVRGAAGVLTAFCYTPTLTLRVPTNPVIIQPPVILQIPLKLPDLTVAVTGPATAMPGDNIGSLVTLTAKNGGTADAPGTIAAGASGGYMIDLVLSGTGTLPVKFATYSATYSDGVLLQGGRVSNTDTLAPGGTKTFAVGGVIPKDTPAGKYCLGAVIDPGGVVKESTETNNATCATIIIGEAPKKLPDLAVAVSGPATALPGDDIGSLVTLTAKNVGTADAAGTMAAGAPGGYMIDLVLSGTGTVPVHFATYSAAYSDGVLLQGGRVSNTDTLAPGATKMFTVGGVIPLDTPAGMYCLGAVIDPGAVVTELDETNNTACATIEIGEAKKKLPDLTIALSGPGTAMPGDDIGSQVFLIAKNGGTADAPGTLAAGEAGGYMIDLVLSTTNTLPVSFATYAATYSDGVLLLGGRASNTDTLTPGANKTFTVGGVIPADTPAGMYCLGAVIDSGAVVTESDETNNTACAMIEIVHKKLPDLTIAVSGPATALPGDDIGSLVTLTATNSGTANAPGTLTAGESGGYMIDLVLSTGSTPPVAFATYSATYSDGMLLLGGRVSKTEILAPTATKAYTVSGVIPADTPAGMYCLGAVIDPGTAVTELDETNNTACAMIEIGEAKKKLPDLTVSVSGPATALPGDVISSLVTLTAKNGGEADAPGTLTAGAKGGYMIDLVLSSSNTLPVSLATYAAAYSDGVLLQGGRVSNTETLPPGGSKSFPAGAVIPKDTKPGVYCLGAVIDPGAVVTESDENNNTSCAEITIGAAKPPVKPGLPPLLNCDPRSKPVAAGFHHGLAVKTDGSVWIWGGVRNEGSISLPGATSNEPRQVAGLSDVVAVAAGENFSLALKPDGTVWAWGVNAFGQLGDGTRETRLDPVKVQGLTNVVAIASGERFSVALKADGTVWAWGDNQLGNLGDGTRDQRQAPVRVTGLTDIRAIAVGSHHSLALKTDGTVWTWGYISGDIADTTVASRTTAVRVPGLSGVMAVAAGQRHSLALKYDRTVWAWGENDLGQLGDGTNEAHREPVKVNRLTGVMSIAAGANHSGAIRANGTIWMWGYNSNGQLGDGTQDRHSEPAQATAFNTARYVALYLGTGNYTLALQSDGTLKAWGDNNWGQIGLPSSNSESVPGLLKEIVTCNGSPAAPQATTCSQAPFADVATDNPACTAIQQLAEAKIVGGFQDNTFRPDTPVTRAQMAKLLVAALKLDPGIGGANPFNDIQGHWVATQGWVQQAVVSGMISGYPDGTFRADTNVTRSQALRMAAGALSLPLKGNLALPKFLPPFSPPARYLSDVDASAWDADWIYIGFRASLLGPDAPFPLFTESSLAGTMPLTRGEAAMLIANLIRFREN